MEIKGTRIGVVVRIRPLLNREIKQGYINTRIEISSENKAITIHSHDLKQQKKFEFDEVFDDQTSQESLFTKLKLNEMLSKVIEGFNATIFAYGPTGSGKTYTMEGYEYDKNLKPIIKEDERAGLIPRITKFLFEKIKQGSRNIEYTVYCTYVQIYKENVYDLLNPAQLKGPGLKLRWNKSEEFYLENLFMHPCYTYSEVLSLYNAGVKNKILASHNANAASSRSHCILSLNIEGIDSETGTILTSKLQLVDLAGSEKVSQTGNEGAALKESIEINKALFTLRQVISTLASIKEGDSAFVPYRDSKLTSLLKQSIGGNSFCLMIACIAPSDFYFEDNLSTLAYATKASCISNEPIKNLDPKTKIIKNLRNDVKTLENELEMANQQILMLTEMFTLDPQEQASRLKVLEKLPLKAEHLNRIKTLRSSIESLPSTPKQSVTHSSRFVESDFSNFSLSPEILSEKLYDSVKMIRDLMNSNKKLKDSVNELNSTKKKLELDNEQLINENQDLIEKLENFENNIVKSRGKGESKELNKIKKEREKMQMKIEKLEEELKGNDEVGASGGGRGEWNWKSKRTVMKSHRNSQDNKPMIVHEKSLDYRNLVDNGVVNRRQLRPLSQDFLMDSTKQEAIATLSKILMKGPNF